jgi:hypothetical protein
MSVCMTKNQTKIQLLYYSILSTIRRRNYGEKQYQCRSNADRYLLEPHIAMNERSAITQAPFWQTMAPKGSLRAWMCDAY